VILIGGVPCHLLGLVRTMVSALSTLTCRANVREVQQAALTALYDSDDRWWVANATSGETPSALWNQRKADIEGGSPLAWHDTRMALSLPVSFAPVIGDVAGQAAVLRAWSPSLQNPTDVAGRLWIWIPAPTSELLDATAAQWSQLASMSPIHVFPVSERMNELLPIRTDLHLHEAMVMLDLQDPDGHVLVQNGTAKLAFPLRLLLPASVPSDVTAVDVGGFESTISVDRSTGRSLVQMNSVSQLVEMRDIATQRL